jgi:hypothetical protein
VFGLRIECCRRLIKYQQHPPQYQNHPPAIREAVTGFSQDCKKLPFIGSGRRFIVCPI